MFQRDDTLEGFVSALDSFRSVTNEIKVFEKDARYHDVIVRVQADYDKAARNLRNKLRDIIAYESNYGKDW